MSALTKRSIMESCVRLLEKHPLNKISVKDIVEDCGINRNTFYYHFADLPALIEAIMEQELENLLQTYTGISSLEECIQTAMAFALGHRQAIFHIYNSANRDALERYLLKSCEHVAGLFVDNISQGYALRPGDREALIQSYKCECFGEIINWLNHGMSQELQEAFLRVCELRRGMAEELCRRSSEDGKKETV